VSCSPATTVAWDLSLEQDQAATLRDVEGVEAILHDLKFMLVYTPRDPRQLYPQKGDDYYEKNYWLSLYFASVETPHCGNVTLEIRTQRRLLEISFVEGREEFSPQAGKRAVEFDKRLKQVFGERVKTHYAYRMKRFAVSN
jgi:hypothetical protein